MAAKRLPCVPKNLCFAPNLFSPHPVFGCRLRKRPRVVATATIEKAGAAVSYSEGGLLRPISGSNTLSEDGIVSVPVSISMVDDIQSIFEQLRVTTGNQFRRCAPVRAPVSRAGARDNIKWTEEIPCNVEASNFRLADGPSEVYDVYTTGFAPTMRWVAVGDRDTLDRWYHALGKSLQVQLEHALGEPLVLCQACFVVVHGGVRDGDAKLHADWAMESIPRHLVYTALTPLSDFPLDVGGLYFDLNSMPKHALPSESTATFSRQKQEVLHRYRRGEAVLFDGKLMHRTQPFANHVFERVLASFSFCTAASINSNGIDDLIQVLRDQTPAYYVSPRGESGQLPPQQLSYTEARDAVRVAGVSDYYSFWHWSRTLAARRLRVPVHPHKAYQHAGWVSWRHFFRRAS